MTIRDTLAWDRTAWRETDVKAGLAPEREAELLAKVHGPRRGHATVE